MWAESNLQRQKWGTERKLRMDDLQALQTKPPQAKKKNIIIQYLHFQLTEYNVEYKILIKKHQYSKSNAEKLSCAPVTWTETEDYWSTESRRGRKISYETAC